MSAYQYHALAKSGRLTKGIIEADSERHARLLLRAQGLIPSKLRAISSTREATNKNKLSPSDLSLFTRQLATLLAAGIPVEEALQGVASQTTQGKARQLIIGVRSSVLTGFSLAQSMKNYPRAFPELYRATIAAGEQTGRLDEVLTKLADYTETQQKTRQIIQQALIYPSAMMFISLLIITFLLLFVVPEIITVFKDSGQTLPFMTRLLISLSHGMQHYGLIIGIALALSFGIFLKSLTKPSIKMRWHQCLLKLPFISYLLRTINLSRYIHTFSILFASGVNVLETMRVAASVVNNLIMRKALIKAATQVKEGTGISLALSETEFLSPMVLHLIMSGEKSGQLPMMMERAANHLDQDVKRLIDTTLTLLEPAIILFMGAMVLFIVLATLLPIFSMQQLVI